MKGEHEIVIVHVLISTQVPVTINHSMHFSTWLGVKLTPDTLDTSRNNCPMSHQQQYYRLMRTLPAEQSKHSHHRTSSVVFSYASRV